jgi:hypothetical protein
VTIETKVTDWLLVSQLENLSDWLLIGTEGLKGSGSGYNDCLNSISDIKSLCSLVVEVSHYICL